MFQARPYLVSKRQRLVRDGHLCQLYLPRDVYDNPAVLACVPGVFYGWACVGHCRLKAG